MASSPSVQNVLDQNLMDTITNKLPSKLKKLPYPLSEFENIPRTKHLDGEVGHYIFFWTCAGCMAGFGLGIGSFYRRHRYRTWVRKQPHAVQLKLLQKNNMSGNASSGIATTRLSTLPRSMDTRATIKYAGEYRPYQWYEWGPLKLWNNFADYPWASELFIESGKWSVRLALLCGTTLAFESSLCLLFGYPLGSNPIIRGIAGASTGYIVGTIASEGVLFWYQSIGIAVGLGALWTFATLYDPNWGEKARENEFVIEMYSNGLHKSVKKYRRSKEVVQQLHEKDLQEKHEIYEEFLQLKQEEIIRNRTSGSDENGNGESAVDTVDMLAAANFKQVKESWLTRLIFGERNTEIPYEIDSMPYEERKKLEQTMLGDSLAVNYNAYPFKGFGRKAPQFFILDNERLRNESDTAKFVKKMKHKDKRTKNVFECNKNLGKRDLRILG